MIRRPPRSPLSPPRRSSDLAPGRGSAFHVYLPRVAEAPERSGPARALVAPAGGREDRKSTRLNSSHLVISYAVFCLKKKKTNITAADHRRPHYCHVHCPGYG